MKVKRRIKPNFDRASEGWQEYATWEHKGFEVFDCDSPLDALSGYDLTEATLLWVVWGLDSLPKFPAESTMIKPFQKLGVVPAENGSVYWPVDDIHYWPSLGHK